MEVEIASAKKWKVEVYCFFLQVRHKFELIFLEVSAKNKAPFFLNPYWSKMQILLLWELAILTGATGAMGAP